MSIFDLEVFADLIEWGQQLIHYLRRRLPLNRSNLLAMEELDLLGAYLLNGLKLPAEAALGAPVRLTTYTEGMDDYYHFIHGLRKRRAERPRMNLPDKTREAVARVAKQELREAVPAGCEILDRALPT